MRDSIELERAAIPAVAIVHRVLEPGARAMAEAAGVPGYPWLSVDYPYEPDGLWSEHEVASAARELAPAVVAALTAARP